MNTSSKPFLIHGTESRNTDGSLRSHIIRWNVRDGMKVRFEKSATAGGDLELGAWISCRRAFGIFGDLFGSREKQIGIIKPGRATQQLLEIIDADRLLDARVRSHWIQPQESEESPPKDNDDALQPSRVSIVVEYRPKR
jgi:hypothetical protein